MMPVFRGVLVSCVVLCLAPGSGLAQPGAKAEARRHHNLGLASMKQKAYGEAIAELNQAYDLGHEFTVLYDIGQAYVAMEQPVFAVKMLKKFLAEGGKQVPASRRKEAEAAIAAQQRRIASVTVRASVDGVVLRVDGIAVGKTPLPSPLELGAGPHFLAASAEGFRPWDQPLDLVGGEKRDLEIRLQPSEVAPAAPAVPVAAVPVPVPLPSAAAVTVPPPESSPAQPRLVETTAAPPAEPAAPFPTRKVIAYALGGVGIAALAVGGTYGVAAITNRRDSDAACPQNQCSQTGVDLNNQAKTAARVADIGIGVGLVSVAVATYLLLRPAQPEPAPASASAPGMRLAAGVGPHQAAVALRGSW